MTVVEEKSPYTVTDAAGQLVAGRPHGGVGSTVELTATEARYELLLGSVVPEGVPVVVPPPVGPVASIDRIAGTRGSRDWDFSVAELADFLFASDLGDHLRNALRDGVAVERDTLAKLSASLDAAVVLLRAGIQTRAPASALADKADAGVNRNITELAGLTTPLAVARGGTAGRNPGEARAGLGLPLVPGDPLFAQAMEALWLAFIAGLPVWDGNGPAPVPAGKPFLQGPGGPVLIAQPE
jgi:hypothetical protein